MRRVIQGSSGVAGLLLVFLACSGRGDTQNQYEKLLPEVEVVEIKPGTISHIEYLTGDIKPIKEAYLSPDVAGKIERIYVDIGDRVKAGQLLVKLDTRNAELAVEQAQAALHVAQANFDDARRNWERMKSLYKEGAVSTQQYEKVSLAYKSAKAQLEQAKAGLDMARHNLKVVDTLFESSACLIGNREPPQDEAKRERLEHLVEVLRRAAAAI